MVLYQRKILPRNSPTLLDREIGPLSDSGGELRGKEGIVHAVMLFWNVSAPLL